MATIPPVRDTMDIYKGAVFGEAYTSYDDTGTVEPLNTYTAACALKDAAGTTTYLTLSTTLNGNGSGITLSSGGVITLIIHPTDTGALAFTDEDSSSVKYARGVLRITKSSSNIEDYAIITFRLIEGY